MLHIFCIGSSFLARGMKNKRIFERLEEDTKSCKLKVADDFNLNSDGKLRLLPESHACYYDFEFGGEGMQFISKTKCWGTIWKKCFHSIMSAAS